MRCCSALIYLGGSSTSPLLLLGATLLREATFNNRNQLIFSWVPKVDLDLSQPAGDE